MTTQDVLNELIRLSESGIDEAAKHDLKRKIEMAKQLSDRMSTASIFEAMEIQDELEILLNITHQKPEGSNFECEGCGS